jgi:hypothetical protein
VEQQARGRRGAAVHGGRRREHGPVV